MSKEVLTVSWIMSDEPLLKLKEPDETYDIKENVFEFIKKNKLYEKEDFKVEVEIDKNEGENGTITYLTEVDSNTKSESTKEKTEQTPSNQPDNTVTKKLTVHGVSVVKKGVKFKEEDVWYTLSDNIDAQSFKDEYTSELIEVYITPTDKGNDIIAGFKVFDVDKKENAKETNQPTEKKQYNNASKSIEAQASLKCAKVIVANMVNGDSKPDFVLKLITKISNHAYQTLQDLKNKE